MATTTQETGRHVALVDIRVPDNVRDLDPEHVKALAGSIGLQGMLVPVVVRNDGDGFELVAGFHRVEAARSLGLTAVPVVIRDAQTEDADRAVENITSCRCRHDVIYADRLFMPTSGVKVRASCGIGARRGLHDRHQLSSLRACGDCRSRGWKAFWRPMRRASGCG
jgi:ParB-like nuclease domain